jgi:hypothetical protein
MAQDLNCLLDVRCASLQQLANHPHGFQDCVLPYHLSRSGSGRYHGMYRPKGAERARSGQRNQTCERPGDDSARSRGCQLKASEPRGCQPRPPRTPG